MNTLLIVLIAIPVYIAVTALGWIAFTRWRRRCSGWSSPALERAWRDDGVDR